MTHSGRKSSGSGAGITRRQFLRLAASGLVSLAAHRGVRLASADSYKVGRGVGTDAYVTAKRAVEACGEWPGVALAGKTVVIKPNLVWPWTADTGVTTDPQVVRLLVDLALDDGAAQVYIVESGPSGANFSACGYDFFSSYDPQGRVTLVDLNGESTTLTGVPGGGLAYAAIYMPDLVLGEDVVFVSVAKLKTHDHTLATLSTKNLMGLPKIERYDIPPNFWRFAMHRRGISQAIVDINLIRPVDFAVIDGIVGMEGDGPVMGTPVEVGVVLAGRNALAVDRACLEAVSLPQGGVLHLTHAAQQGLGPASMSEVALLGDSFTPVTFAPPSGLTPLLGIPQTSPMAFVPAVDQEAQIAYWVGAACETKVEIVQTSDSVSDVTVVDTLHDWAPCPSGGETVTWNGRDDGSALVPPGNYTVRAQARYSEEGVLAYATTRMSVATHRVYLPAVQKLSG
jgi:uncharacterized protein (DUF362 family)